MTKLVSTDKNFQKVLKILAMNIRHFRTVKNLSQVELGLRAELSPSYITDIELCKKNVKVSTIVALANALEIEPYELFVSDRDVYLGKSRIDSKNNI